MINRVVATVSLACVLILVLYLPAAHSPERFMRQLRIEHELNAALWGSAYALPILAHMLDLHDDKQQASPIPQTFAHASAPSPAAMALAVQMAQMTTRLADNPYFKSLDALLALAAYRFSVFTQWLPCLSVFILAALVDGAMCRIVKSKEFLQHHPEKVALYVSMAIMVPCGTVVALVVPITVHPVFLVTAPVWIGVFAGLAVANFHFRG